MYSLVPSVDHTQGSYYICRGGSFKKPHFLEFCFQFLLFA